MPNSYKVIIIKFDKDKKVKAGHSNLSIGMGWSNDLVVRRETPFEEFRCDTDHFSIIQNPNAYLKLIINFKVPNQDEFYFHVEFQNTEDVKGFMAAYYESIKKNSISKATFALNALAPKENFRNTVSGISVNSEHLTFDGFENVGGPFVTTVAIRCKITDCEIIKIVDQPKVIIVTRNREIKMSNGPFLPNTHLKHYETEFTDYEARDKFIETYQTHIKPGAQQDNANDSKFKELVAALKLVEQCKESLTDNSKMPSPDSENKNMLIVDIFDETLRTKPPAPNMTEDIFEKKESSSSCLVM